MSIICKGMFSKKHLYKVLKMFISLMPQKRDVDMVIVPILKQANQRRKMEYLLSYTTNDSRNILTCQYYTLGSVDISHR